MPWDRAVPRVDWDLDLSGDERSGPPEPRWGARRTPFSKWLLRSTEQREAEVEAIRAARRAGGGR